MYSYKPDLLLKSQNQSSLQFETYFLKAAKQSGNWQASKQQDCELCNGAFVEKRVRPQPLCPDIFARTSL